ncbi:MAG: lytic transglycosylase domain-containing protein [Rhodobacteraceae bacterium]|nr:lytic transglycosylase domain-containing protein [Paracoccaceae bacterium]
MTRCFWAIACLWLSVSVACPAHADDPAPFPDFTFKRVKPPKPGSGPRINVQILPEAEQPSADDPATTPGGEAPDAYDWFWTAVSPSLSASGPGRLQKALLEMEKGPAIPAPRLQLLHQIVTEHGVSILTATIGTRVSPALVLAVASIESAGRTDAVSETGAVGLMQLMPDTAARFGVEDATDPAQNIKGAVAFLDWLMGEFDGDPILVLAAYNAGETALRRYEGVPPFAETRAYVPKILAAWKVARGLCMTVPELISDGCAFNLQES